MANKNFVVKNGLVVQGEGIFDSAVTVKGTLNATGGITGAGSGSVDRSEERRVGKEGRSRWAPYH